MNRERLTITMRRDLLKALDAVVDGEKIRNRSHAVEYLLSRTLAAKGTRVLILTGGKPAYFAVEKKYIPKAMVKIAGKPLLEQTLQHLKAAKFADVYISLGESGEVIKDYFGDGSHFGMNISYIHQPKSNKGNAQALLQAKEYFKDPFLLLYGDVLSDIDYGDFVEFHQSQKAAVCTMALTGVETVSMWGLAKLQGSRIVTFEEKPANPKTSSRLVNAGIYLMESNIFNYIETQANKLESDVFPRLAEEGKLAGYPFEGFWLDVSSSAAYKQAVKGSEKN